MSKLTSIKIVIVDDDSITRLLLRTLLRQNEVEVIGEASNGKDALKLCAQLRPDVLCLDINMPKMDGFEVLEKLRKIDPNLKIIMISSAATVANVEAARSWGAHGFIVKPFNEGRVMDTISHALS